ncbi:MAG: hypothetical protein WCI61_10585, partial [Chloroflexota bacterium]
GNMSLSTYWVEDTLSPLPALPGFDVVIDFDLHEFSGIKRISQSEGFTRLKDGHLPYVARMDGQPVGYGWVATRTASIGELDLAFELSPADRYLWDFATLRDETVWLLESAGTAWNHVGIHPYRGEVPVLQFVAEMNERDLDAMWRIQRAHDALLPPGREQVTGLAEP